MALPTHRNPKSPDRTARAPYNFVPLANKALAAPGEVPSQDHYYIDENHHTGSIECTLTTCSPLFTRCGVDPASLEKVEAKDLPNFFANPASGLPTIPGSSLRGMLRTLVEIAGHGKMVGVTRRQLFFRTVDDSNVGKTYNDRMRDQVRGGIYRVQGDRHWIEPRIVGRVTREDLVAAFGLRSWFDLYDGRSESDPMMTPRWTYQHRKVWVALSENAANHPSRFYPVEAFDVHESELTPEPAILVLSGHMRDKEREFVFVGGAGEEVDVDEAVIKRFHDDDQITQWQEKAFPVDQPLKGGRRKKGGLRDGEPVFYLQEHGGVVFLGRAGHFRLPYLHSPADMVPAALRSAEMVDLAESMFGYVDLTVDQPACGGRVFVTDATLKGAPDGVWHRTVAPQVLSGPKPTSIQLYLTQHSPDVPKALSHYESGPESDPESERSTLRGYKLYWHKGDRDLAQIEADPDRAKRYPTQYTRIMPVKSGVSFDFTIHFDNLTDVELGVLLWILQTGADDRYRLKLGMGKPLGLGSVRITYALHLPSREARYKYLFDEKGDWNAGLWPSKEKDRLAQLRPAEEVARQAIGAFEQHIVGDADLNPGRAAQRLEDIPRISALLALLAWPGPDPAQTEYMTDLRQDFAKRKVLPSPGAVAGAPAGAKPAPPEKKPGFGVKTEGPVSPPPQPRPALRLEDLTPGMILDGTVTGIQAYGAFVDIGLGRQQGLVHISQLSDRRVEDVSTIVSIGQRVRVKVLGVETRERKVRIGLSMKGVKQP